MAHLITNIDKTYSIKGGELHGLAIVPKDDNGNPVPTLEARHLSDIFHPIIPMDDLASDGPAFEGAVTPDVLRNVREKLDAGNLMGAFLTARENLFPSRVTLPDWKGVAADMRHAGGGIVPLAVHGEGYKEIENAAMWNAKETALKDIPHIVTTAGTLDGCKRFYICIELPGAAFSAAGEAFREYLCLVTSHDGSMAAQAFISRIRIVCNNTFTAAEAGTSCRFKLKHTKNVDIELPGLHKFIADAHAGRVTFQTNYQQAKDTAISPDRAYAAITGYFYQRTIGRKNDTTGKAGNPRLSTRARNQIDEIFQAFRYGQGNDGRNVADLINGFTEHYTSGTGTGITKEGREMTEGERKVVSTWGAAAEVKTEVTRLLLQPDGTALQELVTIGETKGLDAYLEGTGVSRPVFMSGLDRARSKTAPAPVRAIDFSGEATPAPVVTPVPSNGGSILDDLLGKPFAPKQ